MDLWSIPLLWVELFPTVICANFNAHLFFNCLCLSLRGIPVSSIVGKSMVGPHKTRSVYCKQNREKEVIIDTSEITEILIAE